ncbi:MAG TPA: hypothetical protein VNW94_25555 [Streptosporangiaceae bacterium]|nr:hypothetical protein [Streptosporangiaceae bacterium]
MTVMKRLATLVSGVALLCLAMWLNDLKPHVDARDMDPIRNYGTIGTAVANRTFSVRVDRVEVAGSLAGDLGAKDVTTAGVFVIVHLAAMGELKPYAMSQVRLESGGDTFTGNGHVIAGDPGRFDPLIWRKAVVSFEIPKDRLAGAHLVVGEAGLLTQLSAETDIDLALTSGKSAGLLAHPAEHYDLRAG